MSKLSRYRVLIAGILSPLAALLCYALIYSVLTAASRDPEKDWLVRLCISTLGMAVPLVIALAIARKEPRPLSTPTKAGLLLAVLSLGLARQPISDGIIRWRQIRNLGMHDVPAPLFETPDLSGQTQRLADHKGQVVLVNLWATWCGPCRAEMPRLDRLYQERKQQGLMVYGLSSEDAADQQDFLKKFPVSYPLLTKSRGVPDFYLDIVRYPSIILIDRSGQLQPAPGPDQPFESVQTEVDGLLNRAK